MRNLKIKHISIFCSTIAALAVLSGCDPMYHMTKCPSYVVCYVGLESIEMEVEQSNHQSVIIMAKNNSSHPYSLHSTGAEKDKYEQLCQKHNDLSYNQYRSIGGVLDIESVTYNDCDFSEITITADKDFDETHPAGSNLSDIVRFMSWSPYKYILSGYSKYYHYDKKDVSEAFDAIMRIYYDSYMDNTIDATCYPIDKLVKDLTAEDLILLGYDTPGLLGMLFFNTVPENKGEYNISVSINTDDGRVLKNSIKLTFL